MSFGAGWCWQEISPRGKWILCCDNWVKARQPVCFGDCPISHPGCCLVYLWEILHGVCSATALTLLPKEWCLSALGKACHLGPVLRWKELWVSPGRVAHALCWHLQVSHEWTPSCDIAGHAVWSSLPWSPSHCHFSYILRLPVSWKKTENTLLLSTKGYGI